MRSQILPQQRGVSGGRLSKFVNFKSPVLSTFLLSFRSEVRVSRGLPPCGPRFLEPALSPPSFGEASREAGC